MAGSWFAVPLLRGDSTLSGLAGTVVRGDEGREGAILLVLAALGLALTTLLALGRPELRAIDRAAERPSESDAVPVS